MVSYYGENKHHSYDQWLQGMEAFPHNHYFLFMEDDYCINSDELNFDSFLIEKYKKVFPKNIGYLCSLVEGSWQYHASISNGMISLDTLKSLGPHVVHQYYNVKHSNTQIAFSMFFLLKNIQIFDMSDEVYPLFWQSSDDTLHNFVKSSEKELEDKIGIRKKKMLIVPVQMKLEHLNIV